MNSLTLRSLALGACLTSTLAFGSESPSWRFLEIGVVTADIDVDDEFDPAGPMLNGTWLITDDVFVMTEHRILSDTFIGIDTDFTQQSWGVGYRYALTPRTDTYVALLHEDIDLDTSFRNNRTTLDDSGLGVAVGLRSMLHPSFELAGELRYVDIDDNEVFVSAEARYYFTENFSLGVGYITSDALDTYELAVRYSF